MEQEINRIRKFKASFKDHSDSIKLKSTCGYIGDQVEGICHLKFSTFL